MEEAFKMNTTNQDITFDQVHTAKKQRLLTEMMESTCQEILKLGNSNSFLSTCTVCHSNKISNFTQRFGFFMSQCQNCKHIFCNPMPDKNQLNYYYNSAMKDFENEFFLESFENRIPIFNRRIDIIRQHLPTGKLMDVGSAIGIFLTAIQRQQLDYELFSCDPNTSACALLKQKFPSLTCYESMVEDLTMSAQFDGITMWDTIEHVSNPLMVANKIHSLLRPGGFWFFSTPNTDSFEWSVAGERHVQILPPGHINLFNKASIEHLLSQSNFHLVDSHTLNGSLDISYVQKLLASGDEIFHDNAGRLITSHINEPEFASQLAQFLIETRKAGNIFVIAQKQG